MYPSGLIYFQPAISWLLSIDLDSAKQDSDYWIEPEIL